MNATIALYWILTLTLPDIQSGGDMANLSRQWANSGEFAVISIAADRNDCRGDDFILLLAIRKAENGPKNKEFGIMNPRANNLDKQSGWAAASVVKSKARWIKAGCPGDRIEYMGLRYCPPDAHSLNKNWVKNVKYWFNKLKRRRNERNKIQR